MSVIDLNNRTTKSFTPSAYPEDTITVLANMDIETGLLLPSTAPQNDAERKEAMKSLVTYCSKVIQSWTFTEPGGSDLPINEEVISKLNPSIIGEVIENVEELKEVIKKNTSNT